jgi:hypothetical protein
VDLAGHPVLESHVLDGRPVVPAALLAEWLAHGALHHNPGLTFHGFDDLRVLHGVTLEGPPPVVRACAGKAIKREGLYVAPAELRGLRPDGGEVLHARAEIVLAAELPPAPPARPPLALDPYPHPPEEVYSRAMLFHGPLLQGIERVEGCGEPGIAGLLRAAPAPAEWLRHPLRQRWLADPLVLDGSFQLMVLWTLARSGAPNLPCRLGRYRQWRRNFPASGARAVLAVTRAADLSALADIDYLDESGALLARLEGYECVIDPSLQRAYRRNRLAVAVGS